ncbi:oligopeptide/dipeptide ABC transporter ATP-binding protein [Desulforudis sp. 1031]
MLPAGNGCPAAGHETGCKAKTSGAEVGCAPLLAIENLSVSFLRYVSGWQRRKLTVIDDLCVAVYPGEILAVVGASGAGKSLLAHALLGILPRNALVTGIIRFAGEDLTPVRQAQLRGREIALVPQSVNFLNPLMRVGAQVRAAVRDGDAPGAQRRVFARYRLPHESERLYPFQLSGGMARRVLVAAATVSGARLVIADEPTPGLDAEAARETLSHLRELADEGRSVLLITHDITAALPVADRIAVFYGGTVLEVAPAQDFTGTGESLRHPYSKALWQALPQNGFAVVPGYQPLPDTLPAGCLFAPRCPQAAPACAAERPPVRGLRGGTVRCFYAA